MSKDKKTALKNKGKKLDDGEVFCYIDENEKAKLALDNFSNVAISCCASRTGHDVEEEVKP
jgi:hypothetical protein